MHNPLCNFNISRKENCTGTQSPNRYSLRSLHEAVYHHFAADKGLAGIANILCIFATWQNYTTPP
jgi:hypothetical protein